MKSIIIKEIGKLELKENNIPEINENEVLVKIKSTLKFIETFG